MAADCSNETHFDWGALGFGDVNFRGWSVCLMSDETRVEGTTWSEERKNIVMKNRDFVFEYRLCSLGLEIRMVVWDRHRYVHYTASEVSTKYIDRPVFYSLKSITHMCQ